MLFYASEWSNDEAAAQFFDAYQKVLRGKWKRIEITDSSPDRLSGRSEDGYFTVTRDGKRVLSKEGFAQAFASLPVPARVDNVPREGVFSASSL